MRAVSFLSVVVGVHLAFGAVATAVADTPAPPAAPAPAHNRIHGLVQKVDSAAKTITVSDRRAQSDVTFSVSDDTKYMVAFVQKVSDLKVGDNIHVLGVASGTTIAADGITMTGPHKDRPGAAPPMYGVEGEITALAPLTVKTPDGQAMTVTTTQDTPVIGTHAGSLADVAVGSDVAAQLDSANAATHVEIRPAGLPHFGRRRG